MSEKKYGMGPLRKLPKLPFQEDLDERIMEAIKNRSEAREEVLRRYIQGDPATTPVNDYLIVESVNGWDGISAWLRSTDDEWVLVTPLPSIEPAAAILVRRARTS